MFDARTLLDVAVGTYAVTVVVAATGLLPLVSPFGPEAYAGLAVGVFSVVFAGARSAQRLHRAIDDRVELVMLAVPVGLFAWFVAAAVDQGVVRYPLGVGALGAIPAGVVVVTVHEIRLREWTERTTELASFEARASPRARKTMFGGYAVFVASLLALMGVLAVAGGDLDVVSTVAPAIGGSAAVIPALTDDRDVLLTDEGIRIGRVHRDWDSWESYAITDEALVLSRPGWRRSYRFDRADVENLQAVQRVLDRYLSNRSSSKK